MQQHVFSTQPTYKVCVLIKPSSFKIEQLKQYYIDPAIRAGVNVNDFYGMTLEYLDKKPKAKDMDAYIQKLATIFVNLETQYIYCADSEYFKKLTGQKNSEACIGYAYPCKHSELQHIKVIYGINHSVLFYSPAQEENLNRTVQTLIDCLNLNLKPIGQDIFHKEIYPQDEVNIAACLGALHQHPALTVDIEAFSLDFFKAGVGTITFCWNQHEGIAFNADYAPVMTHDVSGTAIYGLNKPNENVRYFLRQFFDHYKGRLIAHNANYDFKVLIYTLYMKHPRDYEGMLKGIDTLCRLFDDTKIIAYLALNSTEEIKLGLKPLSQEFSGNYSLDAINDITRIPNEKLLRYNLTDGLSTWYVYNKYYPKMVQDEQEELYLTLMKDSIKLILQMELVGMPMSVPRIADAEYQLKVIKNDQLKIMAHNPHVLKALHLHKEATLENINSKLKKIKKDISHLDNLFFNPNSSKQLQTLLYDVMQLPVIDKTDTGLPATGGDTLEKLINHTNDQSKIDVINAIYEYGKAEKILSTFIKAFKQGRVKDDKDFIWLHGSFHLGGTLSGRLSSCVAEWTEVATQRGMIPISQLHIGDLVWTHKRRWQPVLDVVIKPVTPMVDITFCNGYTLTCTTAHKLRLPNGEWKTVQEIIDERIKNVDAEPREHIGNSCSVQSRPSNNACRDSFTTQYDQSQRHTYSENTHVVSRVCSEESPQIFNIERGGQKSYEGQDGGATSQVGGGMFRSQRLSNNTSQWGTSVCSPSTDGTGFGIDQTTRPIRGASCGQQSTEQLIGQFGFSDKPSTSHDSFTASNQCYGKIKEINPRGNLQVWDITVAEDHSYWAQGCFNHNSNPNMQNMPSGSKYGKLIKSCFVAPQSWIMCYADFNALEDRINTLLTKDPNKLKIFIEGYDAHSLRAYNYFPEAYVGVPNTLEGINDAVKTHKEWRNKGKEPTFAIQYGGTEYTLQQNCGFSPELAAKVYQNYHAMYAVSDKFMDEQIAIAARQGYATLAFGLRLRTPILARTVLGTRNTPYAAKAEARTVGNAVGGQSWGLLNNRALAAFMKTVWESEYRYDILPISMIHDASYLLIKDNLDVLNFVNDHLPKEMAWQEAPEIQHPEVGLGGALDICYQGWHQVLEIPNNASKAEIQEICLSAKEKFS